MASASKLSVPARRVVCTVDVHLGIVPIAPVGRESAERCVALGLHPHEVSVLGHRDGGSSMQDGVVPFSAVGEQDRHQVVAAGKLNRHVPSPDHGEDCLKVGSGLDGPGRVVADQRSGHKEIQLGGLDPARVGGESLVDSVESGWTAPFHGLAEGEVQPSQPFGRSVEGGSLEGPLWRRRRHRRPARR